MISPAQVIRIFAASDHGRKFHGKDGDLRTTEMPKGSRNSKSTNDDEVVLETHKNNLVSNDSGFFATLKLLHTASNVSFGREHYIQSICGVSTPITLPADL